MQVLVIESPGKASVNEVPTPTPGDEELLIKVKACGLCGTDVHLYFGEYLGNYPLTPGHEASGVVEGIGQRVTGFAAGDRVAIEPNICCDACSFCLTNQENFCDNWTAVGVTRAGAMAEYVVAPAKNCFHIGDLSFETAAFMEPLSCVLHGLERITVQAGDNAFILGAGPIGLLLLQAVRALGAGSITVVEKNTRRRKEAVTLGASAYESIETEVNKGANQNSFDLVIEATGVPALVPEAIRLARRGGRVLLFGVPPREAQVSILPFEVFRKGLTVASSYTSRRNSIAALRLLQSGKVGTGNLVTHRLSLAQFEEGVRLLDNPEGVLKVQFLPDRR